MPAKRSLARLHQPQMRALASSSARQANATFCRSNWIMSHPTWSTSTVTAWLYDSRDAIAAATRLHDCTLAHCATEYWAAHASLCISLDAPVLRNMTLPQLPFDVPSSLRQLHQDHLASRRAPGGNATVNPTTTADSLKLGICAPFPPFGIPCDPAQVNSDCSFRGSIGIPQIEPMPRSVILSRALPPGSTWPRVVEGVESLPPVRHFQAMPSELRASSSRASLSSNLMALTTCSENKLLVPAKRAGDKCQETSECQFGVCQGSTGSWGTWTRTCVPTVTAIRNLAVNFNSGGSAPPMATTWLPPPGRGSSSNDSDSIFVPIFGLATVFGIGFLVLLLVGRSGRGTKAQPLQTEPRPLYATEVRGPTSQSGNQRAIELAQRAPVSAPPRSTGIVPTASRAQRPVDPDLDEPLPRYVP